VTSTGNSALTYDSRAAVKFGIAADNETGYEVANPN
jgi:hypothetical protein